MAEQDSVAVTTENTDSLTDAQLDAALQSDDTASEVVQEEVKHEEAKPEVKMVPHGALHEERMKRQNAEAKARQLENETAQLRQQWQVGQQRLSTIEQAIARQNQATAPDPAQDPFGAQQYELQRVNQNVESLAKSVHEQNEERRMADLRQQFVGAVQTGVHQFAQSTPDYFDAYNFAKESRVREYIAAGLTEDEAHARFASDEQQIAIGALQRGENPAEVAYRIAQARGYVPPKDKLAMQERGQQTAKPSGGNSSSKISLEALATMDPDEFDKIAGDPKAWKKLMGG